MPQQMKQGVYYFKPLMARVFAQKPLLKKVGVIKYPFLCVITPVFDPGFESLCKLIIALKRQTCGRFIHVMISNGPSPRTREMVNHLNEQDLRFIYDEIEEEALPGPVEILVNLGKRREYCLKKYNADRYVFLDADARICDDDYFKKLFKAHKEIQRDVLITLVQMYAGQPDIILPKLPIMVGHIDMANFTFSQRIAKNYSYPTDFDSSMGISNDYRFFSRIATEDNTALLNFLSVVRDGNSTYKRLTELFNETKP